MCLTLGRALHPMVPFKRETNGEANVLIWWVSRAKQQESKSLDLPLYLGRSITRSSLLVVSNLIVQAPKESCNNEGFRLGLSFN